MNARCSMPGSRPLCLTRLTKCARAADASCSVWPWVNSRSNCPTVAHAYTPVNSLFIPPERITSASSMLSAPAVIPATIEVIFPAGFTPADLTLVALNRTRSASSSDRPVCSARTNTGASPATDTRLASSNTAVARDHESGSFTPSAFRCVTDQGFDNPDLPEPEGTFR
jgi:hypothetical protein